MKFIKIEKCTDCPYNTTWRNTTDGHLSYECRKDEDEYSRLSSDIPKFCPLDDYKDTSELEAEIEELEFQLRPRCA